MLDDICKQQNCEHYIEWEFTNCEEEQPYPCVSCKLNGQSYHIYEVAEECPRKDILAEKFKTIGRTE